MRGSQILRFFIFLLKLYANLCIYPSKESLSCGNTIMSQAQQIGMLILHNKSENRTTMQRWDYREDNSYLCELRPYSNMSIRSIRTIYSSIIIMGRCLPQKCSETIFMLP